MDDTEQQGDPDEELVELQPHAPRRHPRPGHGSGRAGWWVLGGAVLCSVALVAVLVAGIDRGAGPRELQIDAPGGAEEATVEVLDSAAEDEQIRQVVREVTSPGLSVEERSRRVEPAPPGRPPVETIIASFDGLAQKAGADLAAATMEVSRPVPDVALVTITVSLGLYTGGQVRLADLVLRDDDEGWRVSYETACGLAGLAALLSSEESCHAEPRTHRVAGSTDLATVLSGAGPTLDPTPVIATADSYGSVQTGRWVWLVDYPRAELGGGMPRGPAELVRVDVGTGREDGRVALAGTDVLLAGDGERLWALEAPINPDGLQFAPVLTEVDVHDLTTTPGPPVPPGVWAIAAAGDSIWLAGNEVHRLDAATGTLAKSWSAAELPAASPWTTDRLLATADGLWIASVPTAPVSSTAVLFLPEDDSTPVPGPTDLGLLAAADDGVWAASITGATLQRLGTDGSTRTSIDLPAPLAAVHSIWSDGRGGLWLSGPATTPPGDSMPATSYLVTERQVTLHLDEHGSTEATWWTSGSPPMGGQHLGSLGNGLGLVDQDGVRFLSS
jgi:hypothetical protein